MLGVFSDIDEQTIRDVVDELRFATEDRASREVVRLRVWVRAQAFGELLLFRISVHHVQTSDCPGFFDDIDHAKRCLFGHDEVEQHAKSLLVGERRVEEIACPREKANAALRRFGYRAGLHLAREQRLSLCFRASLLRDVPQYCSEVRLSPKPDLRYGGLRGKELATATTPPNLPALAHLFSAYARMAESIDMRVVDFPCGLRKQYVQRLTEYFVRTIVEDALRRRVEERDAKVAVSRDDGVSRQRDNASQLLLGIDRSTV